MGTGWEHAGGGGRGSLVAMATTMARPTVLSSKLSLAAEGLADERKENEREMAEARLPRRENDSDIVRRENG